MTYNKLRRQDVTTEYYYSYQYGNPILDEQPAAPIRTLLPVGSAHDDGLPHNDGSPHNGATDFSQKDHE